MIDCSKKRKHHLACFNYYTVGREKAFAELARTSRISILILTLHNMFFVQCSFFPKAIIEIMLFKRYLYFQRTKGYILLPCTI